MTGFDDRGAAAEVCLSRCSCRFSTSCPCIPSSIRRERIQFRERARKAEFRFEAVTARRAPGARGRPVPRPSSAARFFVRCCRIPRQMSQDLAISRPRTNMCGWAQVKPCAAAFSGHAGRICVMPSRRAAGDRECGDVRAPRSGGCHLRGQQLRRSLDVRINVRLAEWSCQRTRTG